MNWKKYHSIILSVTCHGLRNFPSLIHMPSYPFVNFWNPIELLFFEFESFVKGWMWIGKKLHSIILSVTCHGIRNFPPLMHIPSYPFVNFWNHIELLFFEFQSFVKGWMWIGNKIHSIILSVTCHGVRNFPHSCTSPHIHLWIFETLLSYYFLSFSHL